ncbi:hypothetical protein AMECASPLE_007836 [Ameca splendens]|uniref:Leucine-rich repeat domain, L domain-containing protein n=1 Tax=Ameca splendens TaxID=208324 RepID=A0ABV1A757_9TELE
MTKYSNGLPYIIVRFYKNHILQCCALIWQLREISPVSHSNQTRCVWIRADGPSQCPLRGQQGGFYSPVMLLIDKKKKHLEEEEVVKKLCSVNGLSYEKIASEGSSIRSLEIFFSGFPRMVGLSYFPNLCQLTIVDQNINQIEGLDGCPMLQELWIVQCHLTETFLLL